jgi:nucleoside-diphosphate-sugar epimerase
MLNKMVHVATKTGKIEVFNSHVRRPILGIRDLVRAVDVIINNADAPGLYNVASFNSTVMELAKAVSKKTGANIVDLGRSPTYDFAIDTSKFCSTYNYKFKETPDSIVEELMSKSTHHTNRLSKVNYV